MLLACRHSRCRSLTAHALRRSFFNLPEVLAALEEALPEVELRVEMMEGKSLREQVIHRGTGGIMQAAFASGGGPGTQPAPLQTRAAAWSALSAPRPPPARPLPSGAGLPPSLGAHPDARCRANVLFMRNGSEMLEGMPYLWRHLPGVTYATRTYIEIVSGIHGELLPVKSPAHVRPARQH